MVRCAWPLLLVLCASISLATTVVVPPKEPFAPGHIIVKLRAPQDAQGRPANLSSRAFGQARRPALTPGLAALNEQYEADYEPLWSALRPAAAQGTNPLAGVYRVTLRALGAGSNLDAIVRSFAEQPEVIYAERDPIVSAQATIPNDPYFSSANTWNQQYQDLWGLHRLDCATAWDVAPGSPDVLVAVVDTGLDRLHPDIAANVYANPGEIPGNGIDDDGNGYIDDVWGWDFVDNDALPADGNGHGTHVAGTIAAVGNNGVGVVGVTWNSKLLTCRGLDANGSGYLSWLAQCIVYAADMNADVINNSWSNSAEGPTPRFLIEVVDYAVARGSIVVAAASNMSRNVGTVAKGFYPACIEPVVCVSAIDATGERASFSNFGARVNVAAPGVDILSALAQGSVFATLPSMQPLIVGGQYLRINGTSMACPHAAGALALLRALSPHIDPVRARGLLELAAVDQGAPERDSDYGWGVVNAAHLVRLAPHPRVALLSPAFDAALSPSIPAALVGTVTGADLSGYELAYVSLADWNTPAPAWAVIATGTTTVEQAQLALWSPMPTTDGWYVLRLRAWYADATEKRDHVRVRVSNVLLTQPTAGATLHSATLSLRGSAAGTGFQNYVLAFRPEGGNWSNFRTSTTPVVNGELGVWTAANRRDGIYELRLTVNFTSGPKVEVVQIRLDGLRNEITSPASFTTVSGTVPITGYATSIGTSFTRKVSHFVGWDDYSFINSVGGYVPSNETILHQGSDQVNGGLLHLWNAAHAPAGWGLVSQWVDDVPNDLDKTFQVVFNNSIPQSHAGFPGWAGGYELLGALSAADVDGDGDKELIGTALTYVDEDIWAGARYKSSVFVWNLDRTPAAGWAGGKQMSFGPASTTATLGELDGDPLPEIVSMDNDRVYAWNGDGSPLPGWTGGRALSGVHDEVAKLGFGCPVLYDLDGDGLDEIIVDSDKTYVLRANGANYPGWPRNTDRTGSTSYKTVSAPAVGDIDGDGQPEIVTVVTDNPAKVYAWRRNGAPATGAWPLNIGAVYSGALLSGPVIGDIDLDGKGEIFLCASHRFLQLSGQGAITLRGTWTTYHGPATGAGIVLANLDADPQPEMIVPTTGFNFYFYMSHISVFDHDGTLMWRKYWNATSSHEIAAVATDITGDGVPEILCPVSDRLYAWDTAGNELPGWPIGGINSIVTAPLVDDLDGDGLIEVAYGSLDYWLYLWDLPAPYNHADVEWAELRGGRGHAGYYNPVRLQPTPTPTRTFTPTATPTNTPRVWHGISAQ